jgi:hypothetical protein
MRFSAAIQQIVVREPEPAPPANAPSPAADGSLPTLAQPAVPAPPPDLDQRVRLTGEW